MNNGFIFLLAGLVVLAALLAGMSLAPQIRGAVPRASSTDRLLQTSPATNTTSLPGLAPPTLTPPPPPPAPDAPKYTFRRDRGEEPKREINYLYTKQAALLRKAPGGDPYSASSICFAPLTILPGTRLWPIETRGDWIMVRSPSHMIGWLARTEVDRRTAYRNRSY